MTMMRLTSLGLAGLMLSGLASACTVEDDGPIVSPELEAMQADAMIFNFQFTLLNEGIREAIVVADTAYRFNDSTVVYLRGNVELTSFEAESGVERAVITAHRARLEEKSRAVTAWVGAVLRIREVGRELQSEEIKYEPNRNRVSSDSTTVMIEGETVVEGSGFTSDLKFTNVVVENPRSRPRGGGP